MVGQYQYCDLTLGGSERDCTGAIGGIARVLIAAAKDIKTITIDENGMVSAITPVTEEGKPFHEYWCKKGTAVFNTTYTPSETSDGTHANTILFQLQKMKSKNRDEYLKLVAGETIVLFQDNNELWWLLGTPTLPATATAGDGTSGQAITDYNGFNVTLGTTDRTTPSEVEPDIVEPLIAVAA